MNDTVDPIMIVGLGNVGTKYAKTRHNLGFMVVDELAGRWDGGAFSKHGKAQAEVLDLGSSRQVILVKPTTMMNLSGQAAGELARFYKLDREQIWAVYDDADLEFKQLRVRQGGSSGGHNGVKSLIAHLGQEFWRFRLGIGNEYLTETPTDRFVLDKFTSAETSCLQDFVGLAADVITRSLDSGPTDHSVWLNV